MKKIYKKIIIACVLLYFVITLIAQQKELMAYKTEEASYNRQLEEATSTQETLVATKENANSLDYIEEIAREKLDMYLPNERIYIDLGK